MRIRALQVLILSLAVPVAAQQVNPDRPEPGSREAIAAATTEPRFLSPWVADVPDHPTIPSPTKFLGHIAGAPGELTRTERIYAYYRALAAASPRVRVETIGKTEEGRDLLLVIVGDERTVANLDKLRADMSALADPRRTDEAAMEQIVARTKPFYMLHGGLHSRETGSPEMLMELVYRLAVSDAPWIKEIRNGVTVLINPVAEPDGRDRAVDWFYRNLKGKTNYDDLPPVAPPFWGKYVRHDNNRDGVQRKLALTRATQDTFLRWHPVIVHDLHESIPLLSIWTGTGPYNPNMDPIATTEWHTIAFYEVTMLTAFGMPGVWTYGYTEGFSQFYADSVASNHNAIGRGYETFGNGTAETVDRVIDRTSEQYTGRPVTERDWYRSSPPPARLRWSLRNNTNYMESGVLAALQYTARNGQDMLRNFWRRGRNAVEKGIKEAPFAIAIPEDQTDRPRLATVVNLLRAQGIEVSRSRDAFTVKEGAFPAGTFVVRMDQPYRGFALDLLLPQQYPIDDARYPPLDVVSWALPVAMGLKTSVIGDESIKQVPVVPVSEEVRYRGSVKAAGSYYVIRDTTQESFLAARVRLSRFAIDVAEKPFSVAGVGYPAGSWLIADQPGLTPALDAVATEFALDVEAAGTAPDVPHHAIDIPRIAVLQTWRDTQSAGWVRMIFDAEQIPYTAIIDDDVKAGRLNERFDVILMPNTEDSLKNIITGIDPKFSPLPYSTTASFPTQGTPMSSPDITGGLTWKGMGNLEEFVRNGGVFVTLGGASTLPLDGGIARDVRRATTPGMEDPGSALRARFLRTDHPIAYGYPETIVALHENRALYSVNRPDTGRIVMQWGAAIVKDPSVGTAGQVAEKSEPLVVSGGVKGASQIEGKPAILDIPTGKGRVVAFDFDPIHRYETVATFRLVWNVILNWNDFPAMPR